MSTLELGLKKPKKRPTKRALRFDIELKINDPKEYTTVDFPKLVQDMVSNMKSSKRDSLPGDDDREIADMAAYFEEKYNRSHAFKYEINKGEGYENEDDFIDDSEAYDEIIPPGMETQHGGFYINCGNLELVQVPEPEDRLREEREAERERASILQKLKHKRKASELENMEVPKIKKVAKPIVKAEPGTSASVLPASNGNNAKPPQNDEEEEVQLIGEKPAPKDNGRKGEESILSSAPKNNNSLPQDPVSKLITKLMNESPDPAQHERFNKLKSSLVSYKIPIELISRIPITKIAMQPNGLLPNDWNHFLIDLFKKTSSSEVLRSKIFEAVAEYVAIPQIDVNVLFAYTMTLSQNLAHQQESKPYSKYSTSSSSLLSTSNANNVTPKSSSKVPSSSSVTITPSSSSSNTNNVNNNSALNLSKSTPSSSSAAQNAGFGEGLASKLQADRSTKASPKPNVLNAQMENLYNSILQTQAGGDKKVALQLFTNIMAANNAISAASVLSSMTPSITSRPGVSNSPSVLASNSLLQPTLPTMKTPKSSTVKHQPTPSISNPAAKLYPSGVLPGYSAEDMKRLQDIMKSHPQYSLTNNIINSAFGQFSNPLAQAGRGSAGTGQPGSSIPTSAPSLASLSPGGLHFAAQHFNQNPKSK